MVSRLVFSTLLLLHCSLANVLANDGSAYPGSLVGDSTQFVAHKSLSAILEAAKEPKALDFVVRLRRAFHSNPELMYEEANTSALIRQTLQDLGVSFRAEIAKTGVVADIGTGHPPVVILRADMDALPVQEEVEGPFKSTVPGKMHACGHDAHTAMLLGAARLLKAREADLQGTVRLVFQPAEEGGAGAKRMIEADDGAILASVAGAFALHVAPQLQVGRVGGNAGPALAGSGCFRITVQGTGGHAAMPQQTKDPIVAAAHIISSLQSIVSREADPLQPHVVSVTRIHGGHADNIIPDSVELGGTFRAFSQDGMAFLESRIRDVAAAQASVFGCIAAVDFKQDTRTPYPPTVNKKEAYELGKGVVARLFSGQEERFSETAPIMGGEDFSFFLNALPTGAIFWLGVRNESVGAVHPLHSPKFQIDESALPVGVAFHVAMAEEFLKLQHHQQQQQH